MKLDLFIRVLWSGWFGVGAILIVVAFVTSWRKRKLNPVQVFVLLLLTPIFSVGAVNVWFRPSRPPNLIDGILAMFVFGALATGLAKAWEKRRTRS